MALDWSNQISWYGHPPWLILSVNCKKFLETLANLAWLYYLYNHTNFVKLFRFLRSVAMTEAVQEQVVETQETEKPTYSFREHLTAFLEGLALGGMVGGFFFGLVFGAEFAAQQFNLAALTTKTAELVFYNLKYFLPGISGLIAFVFFYRFTLKLPSDE
jgi:hypothetical protein